MHERAPRRIQCHDPIILHEEANEALTPEMIAEAEAIFADMLFEAWRKKRGFK